MSTIEKVLQGKSPATHQRLFALREELRQKAIAEAKAAPRVVVEVKG